MKKPRKVWWKVWLRRLFLSVLAVVLLAVCFVGWANFAAYWAGKGRLHDRTEDVPAQSVGLVFGCAERYQGRENLYFRYRINAAAELWKAGKLKYIIVSGDNRERYYNEPEKMRSALVKSGVPFDKIHCDYAGLRTLDSVVRAKEVFSLEKVVFISQRFQNERAAYIAQANGLDYEGYNARDVNGRAGLKVRGREALARVRMWMDVNVLHTRPAYARDEGDLSMQDSP